DPARGRGAGPRPGGQGGQQRELQDGLPGRRRGRGLEAGEGAAAQGRGPDGGRVPRPGQRRLGRLSGPTPARSGQPPVLWSAVVQLVAIAPRAAARVTVPAQTSRLSRFSTESLLAAVVPDEPDLGSGHRLWGSRGAPPSSSGT